MVCNGLALGGDYRPPTETAGKTFGPGASSADDGTGFKKITTSTCQGHVPPTGGMLGDPKAQWLRANQSDPYIQGLMKELEVTTPEALEKELVQILAQRRAGM